MIRYTERFARELAELECSEAYYLMLRATIERAEQVPNMGQRVRFRPDMFRVLAGTHHVYYRVEPEGIVVVRLMHTRRMRGRP